MGRTGLACPCWSIRQDVDVGMMRRNDCQPLRCPRSSDDHCLHAWCDRANCDNDHSRRGRWIFCAGWTVWAASRSCSSLPDRQQDRWPVHRLSIQVQLQVCQIQYCYKRPRNFKLKDNKRNKLNHHKPMIQHVIYGPNFPIPIAKSTFIYSKRGKLT